MYIAYGNKLIGSVRFKYNCLKNFVNDFIRSYQSKVSLDWPKLEPFYSNLFLASGFSLQVINRQFFIETDVLVGFLAIVKFAM